MRELSIIIPTYNRAASLRKTLDSIATQTFPTDEYEVVVVDDGSTESITSFASRDFPFELRCVRQTNLGAAMARNNGAHHATGRLLLFLDDDILLHEGFLTALVQAHGDSDRLITMGSYLPVLNGRDTTYARHRANYIAAERPLSGNRVEPFTECASNNLAVERDAFFAIGQWRDLFGDGPTLWGDVEFGYRAQQHGFRFLRVYNALLYHCDYTVETLDNACRRAHHIAELAPQLFALYPELKPALPMFNDKAPVDRADPARLRLRKVGRAVSACTAVEQVLRRLIDMLERTDADSRLLPRLYTITIGAHLVRGYRAGLEKLDRPSTV